MKFKQVVSMIVECFSAFMCVDRRILCNIYHIDNPDFIGIWDKYIQIIYYCKYNYLPYVCNHQMNCFLFN